VYGRGVHAPIDLRFGGGAGEDGLSDAPHLSLTLSAGRRYVEGVPAFSDLHSDDGQPRTPQLIAGFRFFVSGRRTVEPAARTWVTAGVELDLGFTGR
jgi:hypothetical protein